VACENDVSEEPRFVDNDFMIVWNRGKGRETEILVVPWPENVDAESRLFRSSAGCCDQTFNNAPDRDKQHILVGLFLDLVIRKRIDPVALHREFSKIGLWREMDISLPTGRYRACFPDGEWYPHVPDEGEAF